MVSVTLRSEADGGAWLRQRDGVRPFEHPVGFVPALFSGGDSRIAADPQTGLNKYLCPTTPTPELVCVSSCTASPASGPGFDRAAEAFSAIARAISLRQRADLLAALTGQIEARLLQYFGLGASARASLCSSGTDALLKTTLLIAAERPGEVITAIIPAASETGTGVPMVSVGHMFDGPLSGISLGNCTGRTVEIPLRATDGTPHCAQAVADAFAAAAGAASGHVIVTLTHGTKTGLIAPVTPPDGVDVIVDACQTRIAPATVAAYLRRGWPVVVTGSKFFGGPAFSGAILFPRARLPAHRQHSLLSDMSEAGQLGTVLRWTAALAEIDAFEPRAAVMADILASRTARLERLAAANPALVPVGGLPPCGPGWADRPSIFTFAVRDPMDPRRLLSAAGLRPLYERLARSGVLLGQPVGLGAFGGLRVALGARELLDEQGEDNLAEVFATLEEATAPSHGHST